MFMLSRSPHGRTNQPWLGALLLFSCAPVCRPSPLAGETVQIDGRIFTIADGFQLTKVAGPPLVDRPITIDFDEQGRLYAADSSGSNDSVRQQLEEKPHRIVRLEDENGDGVFDRTTVFADRMMLPEGTLWHDGSLYVSAPPQIWKLTDTNDDGVADSREVWYDGKTLSGCANDLHGPYLGRDGWIYWCKGGFAEQQIPLITGTTLKSSAAHIFRRRVEGGNVDIVMTGGMDNPVDVVSSPEGERFFTTTFAHNPSDGLRDGVLHAVYGGLYGKQHGCIDGHPATGDLLPVMTDLGPAAPCGMAWVEPGLFTDNESSLAVCQFNLRKVSRHILVAKGACYETRNEDLVVSEDIDFHPTDVVQDADGSLLIVDTGGWYKLCCPTSHIEKPQITGGIYRLSRKDAKPVADPRGADLDWDSSNGADLVTLLDDDRFFVRLQATKHLRKQGAAAVAAISAAMQSASSSERLKRECVWCLAGIEHNDARKLVRTALGAGEESVRRAALHVISLYRDALAADAVWERVQARPSAAELRCCYEVLGRIGDKNFTERLLAEAEIENDRMLDHSLIHAIFEIGDVDAMERALSPYHFSPYNPPSPEPSRRAVLAISNLHDKVRTFLVFRWLSKINDSSYQDSISSALIRNAPQWSGDAKEMQLAMRHLLQATEENVVSLEIRRKILAAYLPYSVVQKEVTSLLAQPNYDKPQISKLFLESLADADFDEISESLAAALVEILGSNNDELTQLVMNVMSRKKPSEPAAVILASTMRAIAEDDKRQLAIRAAALAALPAEEAVCSEALFAELLSHSHQQTENPETSAAACRALAHAKLTTRQRTQLAGALPLLGPIAFNTLLRVFENEPSPELVTPLLTALETSPAAASVPPARLTALFALYGEQAVERGALLVNRLSPTRESQVARMEELLATLPSGNPLQGLQTFRSTKAACSTCHRIGYVGGRIGPDLSRIGAIRVRKDLLESILFPSSSFVRSYEPLLVVTTSGELISGLVKSRGQEGLTLILAADKERRIPLSEIEEERPGDTSIMPAGLDKQLTTQELADLLAFLESAK